VTGGPGGAGPKVLQLVPKLLLGIVLVISCSYSCIVERRSANRSLSLTEDRGRGAWKRRRGLDGVGRGVAAWGLARLAIDWDLANLRVDDGL
jgi:hypothetical protein